MPKGIYKHKPRTEESKKKQGETLKRIGGGRWNKGQVRSDEFKENQRIIQKGRNTWMKGRKFSQETREKMRKRMMGNKYNPKREESSNWKGGISFLPYPIDWTDDLRESIRKRDGYMCQICGIHQDELEGCHKKLSVHHIDYNKDNLNPNNLVSLCNSCHIKTNFSRDYWVEYFNKEVCL